MADSLTYKVEVPLPDQDTEDEQPAEQPPEDGPGPGRRILSGIGQILGGLWDAIKPEARPPAEPQDE